MFSLVGLVRLYSKIHGHIEALDRCNRKYIILKLSLSTLFGKSEGN